MKTTRMIITFSALVLPLAGLTACGAAPSRSGSAADPVTISSGFGQGSGAVGSDALEQLVGLTSDAAVSVQHPVAGTGTVTEELDAVARLRKGDFDLTLVRADTLATAGADSLAVLQTPFLVTSEVQAARVAADPVAEDLMAGLDELGLVGIALVPGGLRHPFGYYKPLLGPEDYAGTTINVRPGDGIAALVEGLGAAVDTGVDERDEMAFTGKLRGIEVSLQLFGAVTLPAVLTSNVTLYTKFDVIVMDREAWDGLSGQQQEALRAAAAKATAATLEARDNEDEGLARWCRTPGAESVRATDGQVEALKDELQPVVEAFTSAPGAADLAERVRELGRGTTDPAGAVCGSTEVADVAGYTITPRGDQHVLDGVWRMEVSRQAIIDAGGSQHDGAANAGVWTVEIRGGNAVVDQPNGDDCAWDFNLDGDRISLAYQVPSNDNCFGYIVGTYDRTGDRITFDWEKERDYDVALDQAIFADGMQKIG